MWAPPLALDRSTTDGYITAYIILNIQQGPHKVAPSVAHTTQSRPSATAHGFGPSVKKKASPGIGHTHDRELFDSNQLHCSTNWSSHSPFESRQHETTTPRGKTFFSLTNGIMFIFITHYVSGIIEGEKKEKLKINKYPNPSWKKRRHA